MFYLDANNLIHDNSYNSSTGKWDLGALSYQGYTAMPNSSLTAIYNQCKLCANTTIIAFQDENGFVQIGNLTSGGWTLTQLGPALRPEMGTGLALQPFYRNGLEDQINLFHQQSNLTSFLLLMLETQMVVGPSTNKSTTASHPVPPSPQLPPRNLDRSLVTFQRRHRSRYLVGSNK